MIYALTSRNGAFGIGDYLKTDGIAIAPLVTVLCYEDVFDTGVLPIGSYLFTGLDELTLTETSLVCRVRDALSAASPSLRLLNDPTKWLSRPALLEAASDAGMSSFRTQRATMFTRPQRYPVFVRSAPEHTGALSPLLYNYRSVVRALLAVLIRGYRLRDLLIAEYVHTADHNGVFTKYSAMIVDDRIVPRSMTMSRERFTKFEGRLTDAQAADADLKFVEENPHESWLRTVFALAGVEYGRVDYAVVNGTPQLWEINTNPTIGANLACEGPTTTLHSPTHSAWTDAERARMARGNLLAYKKLAAAIDALARCTENGITNDGVRVRSVTIPISRAERARLASERRTRARVLSRITAVSLFAAPWRYLYRLRHRLR